MASGGNGDRAPSSPLHPSVRGTPHPLPPPPPRRHIPPHTYAIRCVIEARAEGGRRVKTERANRWSIAQRGATEGESRTVLALVLASIDVKPILPSIHSTPRRPRSDPSSHRSWEESVVLSSVPWRFRKYVVIASANEPYWPSGSGSLDSASWKAKETTRKCSRKGRGRGTA